MNFKDDRKYEQRIVELKTASNPGVFATTCGASLVASRVVTGLAFKLSEKREDELWYT